MKKIFTLIAVVAMFATTQVNAQNFRYGIKGGLNLATFGGKDAKDVKFGTAWNVGLVSEYVLNEKMAIQPEILFSHQGAKVNDVKHKLNYVTLPVMFKYDVYEGLNLQVGPEIGYLLVGKAGDTKVTNKMRRFAYGLNFGAGYKFTDNIILDARYNLGLSKLYKDSYTFNRVFQLSIGYLF